MRLGAAAVGLAASLVVLAAGATGALADLEGVATDLLLRVRGPAAADPRIALVAIDRDSLDRYGRWPWRRDRTAELVTRIAAAGARVIALDMVFAEPSRRDEVVDLATEDQALARALAASGNAVLGYFFRRERPAVPAPDPPGAPPFDRVSGDFQSSRVPERPDVEENLPLFAEAAAAQGFYDQRPEAGVHRHYQLVARHQGFHYPALALAAAGLYLEAPLELRFEAAVPVVLLGDRRVAADEGGRLWLDYRGPAGSFPTVSAARVLDGGETAPLRDRLVFVGFTEAGLGEVYTSPFGSPMTGLEVHAHAADNLLAGRFLHDTGNEAALSALAVLLLGPLAGLLVVAVPGRAAGSAVALALVLAWPFLAYRAFVGGGWHLAVVAPVLSGLLALAGQVVFEGRSRWIRRTFEQFVAKDVVAEMLRHPERVRLGGESKELTVLFCDIRGFTSLSEGREPHQVVELLNRFFTPMTAVVLEHRGTLDKYMGDALMAFFGAPLPHPHHAADACRAALAMTRELARLRTEDSAGPLPPDFGIGIGLNTGPMTVGNMGSDQIFDYTVIGDAVNLGSRVEGLTRRYGVEVVATELTRAAAGDGFLFRELDRVRVKGRAEPVRVYQLVAERPVAQDPAFTRLAARVVRFEEALAAYRGRRFAAAAAVLEELLTTDPADGPAALLLPRCRALDAEPPPQDWDAVLSLTSK
jgi:adenylate cyclase